MTGSPSVLARLLALVRAGPEGVLPSEAALVALCDEATAVARDDDDPVSIMSATVATTFLLARRAEDAGRDDGPSAELISAAVRILVAVGGMSPTPPDKAV